MSVEHVAEALRRELREHTSMYTLTQDTHTYIHASILTHTHCAHTHTRINAREYKQ